MIVKAEKAKAYINTNKELSELEERLLALELSVRKYTNNKFLNRNIRGYGVLEGDTIHASSIKYLKEGDTIEISESKYNAGLYVIKEVGNGYYKIDGTFNDEVVLITKVEYPLDVQMGVIDILRWQLKNEAQNYDPNAPKEIQSETLSRHSVTYAKDATESDIHEDFGCPRKYIAFLKRYKKARFD